MKLTDLQVVQITNALIPEKGGILNQELPYKLRYRLNKILGQLKTTYTSAMEAHDNILRENYGGLIKAEEKEKLQAFNNEWATLLREDKSEYSISKIPIELIEDVKMNAFHDLALDILIDKPEEPEEEVKKLELVSE